MTVRGIRVIFHSALSFILSLGSILFICTASVIYIYQSGKELITSYVVVRMTLMILFCITIGEDFLRPTYTLIRNHPVYVSACRNVHIVFCLCPSVCSFVCVCIVLWLRRCTTDDDPAFCCVWCLGVETLPWLYIGILGSSVWGFLLVEPVCHCYPR